MFEFEAEGGVEPGADVEAEVVVEPKAVVESPGRGRFRSADVDEIFRARREEFSNHSTNLLGVASAATTRVASRRRVTPRRLKRVDVGGEWNATRVKSVHGGDVKRVACLSSTRGGGDGRDGGGEFARHRFVRRGVRRRLVAADALRGDVRRIQRDAPPKRLVLAAILAAYAPVPHLVLRALRVVAVVVVAIVAVVAVVVAVSPRAMFGRVGA